jgi:hypothetical protein
MNRYYTEVRWAFLFIAMMLLWMIGEKALGLHDPGNLDKHAIYTNFIAIPAIGIYVFALLDKKKKDYDKTMSYKQGLLTGCIITLIITVMTPLNQYIISTYITPDYFTNAIAYSVEKAILSQADATEYFSLHNYIKESTIFSLAMGLATSVIVAFFTKSKTTIQE